MKRMLDKREILFKAKKAEKDEWIEGRLFYISYCGELYPCIEEDGIKVSYYDEIISGVSEVKENTICQFTGLKDKNGNKIFEGDILNIIGSNKPGLPAPVVFLKEQCKFVMFRSAYNHINLSEFDTEKKIEIVGNVYD